MAGRGPAPKDPAKRARRNKTPDVRVIEIEPTAQPKLPSSLRFDGERFSWPKRTKDWWQMWGDSPLAAEFTDTDWSELLDTALLHARFWQGDLKLAGELRLRVAKFGATPEDRARLRITFAQADDADERRGGAPAAPGGRRRGNLRLAE